MSLRHDILTILTDYHGGYKIMRKRMYGGFSGIPHFELRAKIKAPAASLSVTLSRLKKNGLISREGIFWKITELGKNFVDEYPALNSVPRHTGKIIENRRREKNMIIAFDIPELHRRKRNWLRTELVNLGFIKIQKSFWFGPTPLPKKFIESLHSLSLLPYLKFFNAREEEIV